jgi:hypothetical protein
MRLRSCGPAPPRPTRTRIANENGLRRSLDKAPIRTYGSNSDTESTPEDRHARHNRPRGVPHTYRVGDAGARWLVTSSPAGFERFVAAVSASATADPAELARLAADHGIEILGPPGMLP